MTKDNAATPVIRPAVPEDAAGIARVHVESWRSTYRGIVPDSVLDTLDVDRRAAHWRQAISDTTRGQFVRVAEHPHHGVVGFVAAGPERSGEHPPYSGEVYAIYLLDAWQGLGAGRALFEQGVRSLLGQGHRAMLIWALTENPACDFYRRMGGEAIATQRVTMGQKTLEETAFGWKNISMVLDERDSGDEPAEGTRHGGDQ